MKTHVCDLILELCDGSIGRIKLTLHFLYI